MLSHSDVADYLLETGLLDPDSVAASDIRVLDVSGRNRVFVVAALGTVGYVVKQPEAREHDLLAREAAVLRQVVQAEPRLARFVPTPVLHDPARRVLVCELLGDAVDLAAYHARGRFPPLLAHGVGCALGLLHGLSVATVDDLPEAPGSAFPGLPGDLPSLELVLDMSDAGVRLLGLLQGSTELCERLAELEQSWQAFGIVHGDMRASNCVAFPRVGRRRRTRIALVDWESARAGDPHLDVGIVLGEYLCAWLWSMPILDGSNLAHAPRYARYPLVAMQPAVRRFWFAYLGARHVGRPSTRPSLRRAIEFAAAHVVQIAFDRAQVDSSLDPRAGLALQLSLNMFRRPTEAAVQLLGLPIRDGGP